MISPGKHKCRNGWEVDIEGIGGTLTAEQFLMGMIHSPVCGYWMVCTWTLDGKCWYGEQLDIEETK